MNKYQERQATIVIAGDLFPRPINYKLFSEGMISELFGNEVCNIFSNADFSICNLEGCFTDESTNPMIKDGPNIRAPKNCINGIKRLGVDCVTLANNHVTDFGLDGLKDTFNTLEENEIDYFGAGESEKEISNYYKKSINGLSIVFYGVSETIENLPGEDTPGVNVYDEYRVCSEIEELKAQCDYLVVLYHGGIEEIHYNTPQIVNRFHRMADSGADIIISQHTHAIGEEEYYNGSYLLYGQGNFCFHNSKTLTEWVETGLLLVLEINNEKKDIKKHVVRRVGTHIVYDKPQDLTDFYNRSRRLEIGETFDKEFKKYSDEKIGVYLQAFRGKNLKDKVVRKLFSKKTYYAYLKKQFTKKNILKILLALQSEEFGEVCTQGMLNLLEELHDKSLEK